METNYTLFTEVKSFYHNLLSALAEARQTISLMYFTFDAGEWSAKIGRVFLFGSPARTNLGTGQR